MRILIVTDTYPPDVSGSSFFTHRLAAGLAARDHDVHIVCASDTGPRKTVREHGVLVHRLRSLRLLIHPTARFVPPPGTRLLLRRLVGDVRPDVVHTQDHFTLGRAAIAAAKGLGIPLVATNHFMPANLLPYLPRWMHAPVTWVAWRDFHRIYRSTDHLTTPTQCAADLIAATGFTRQVEPVSCGVDLARFHPVPGPKTLARKEFDLPDRPTVGFVGRLDVEKRLDELVRALAAVRKHTDAQLVLAGTGTQRADLERLAARLQVREHVHFLGFVPDEQLPTVYAAADVFTMPGVAELQSIATLEAMASGLPVVAANAVALPHLVTPGENGFLFTSGDTAELADALRRILISDELRARMGAASRAIADTHDENRTLSRFEEIYRHVTRSGVRPPSPETHRPLSTVSVFRRRRSSHYSQLDGSGMPPATAFAARKAR